MLTAACAVLNIVLRLWVVRALSRGAFHDWNGAPARAHGAGVPRPPAPNPAPAG